MSAFESRLSSRLDDVMAGHVETGETGGVAWLAMRDGEIVAGSAGTLTRGEASPVARDSIFRIASLTKPIAAVAALLLVEECRMRLDEPVDGLLPELAARRVLVEPLGPMSGDTVPATRPITLRDLLTNRCGLGMDFTAPWPQPLIDAMGELDLGTGPPLPQVSPEPDEWTRRLGTLPLVRQPGERWLYNTSSDILGVLIARAADQPFDEFLRERIFDPLCMVDTGFSTATARLGTAYAVDPSSGERSVFDAPDGQWSSPPAFPSGAGGLVSTVDDLAAFGRLLLEGGRLPDGTRLLARSTVAAMTTDQLGPDGRDGVSADGSMGWGFGVGVQTARVGPTRNTGSYGWVGGLGSSWHNDPAERLVGVVLSTDMLTGPDSLPRPLQDFWTTVYSSLG